MPKLSQKDIALNSLLIMVQNTNLPVEEAVGDVTRNIWQGAKVIGKNVAKGVGNVISPTATAGLARAAGGVKSAIKGLSSAKKGIQAANPAGALKRIISNPDFRQTFPEITLTGNFIELIKGQVVYIPFKGKQVKGTGLVDVSGNITMTKTQDPNTKIVEWKLGGIYDPTNKPLADVRVPSTGVIKQPLSKASTAPSTPPTATPTSPAPPSPEPPTPPTATPTLPPPQSVNVDFTNVKNSNILNLWNIWYNQKLTAGEIGDQRDVNHVYPIMIDFAKNIIQNSPNIDDYQKQYFLQSIDQYITNEKPSVNALGSELKNYNVIPESVASMWYTLNKVKFISKNPAKPLDF